MHALYWSGSGEICCSIRNRTRRCNFRPIFLAFLVTFGSLFVIGSAVVTIVFISYKDLLQNLLKGESRLRAIIETSADAIVMIDSNGIIQEFKVTAEKKFGWSAKEIIGQNVKLLMPNPYRDGHDDYLSNY